ncbi:Gfo/Idh/MocA family oxidoreductase [candidate division KSB1 bacterium]|nr:Gfo/Idh/MocA family oxidoreductase [candidate division KSB1 bacterium]
MSKLLNIGIIGGGMIADHHIENLRKDGRAEITWLAEINPQTLQAKLQKYGIKNGTSRYQDMLADKEVEAIIIATPPFTHLEMALDVLRARKHLLLEKPMVINPAQLQTLLAEVQKYPKQIVLECSGRHARLQPKFRFIKKLIDSGAIGDVYHIHHNQLMRQTFIEYNPAGAWAMQKKLAGGGPILDWGVYDLSFHLGLLNDKPQLQKVTSFKRNGIKVFADPIFYSDVEEHAAAYLEFDTGLTYYYERGAGVQAEIENETRIFGTKGSLQFSYCTWNPPEVIQYYIDADGREQKAIHVVNMKGHANDSFELSKHFMDCLLNGVQPIMPVTLAAKHLEILFKILSV